MKTQKIMMKPIIKDHAPTERFSLRFQDGVEIYEHEIVRTRTITKPAESPLQTLRDPRLVIVEPSRTETGWIAKTRSEIAGLATVLCTFKAVR